jgi:hypothetical protein
VKNPTLATTLTGHALPHYVASAIEAAANDYARMGAAPADHDRVRDSYVRGAVAGYTGGARAVSDSPMAQAHRAGHDLGVMLRRRVAA